MADRPGWLLTIRQTAPDAYRLVRKLAPTYEVAGATSIDESFLETHGIRGLIWDVDGTLTGYHAPVPPADVAGHLERLAKLPWLKQVILSNCGEDRFVELGDIFPGTEILKVYEGPSGRAYRRLLGGREEWDSGDTRPAGLRPIRKPHADLVRYAVRRLGVETSEAAMVGDQYWTDVAGANLAGVRSIKVPALIPSSFPATIRFFQAVESVLRRMVTK